MTYVKIENNIVVQKQPNDQEGFVKVHPSVISGMVHDGGDSFAKDTFSSPVLDVTWSQVRRKQRSLILAHSDLMQIHEREVAHTGTSEDDYTISAAQYQSMLDYFQIVRINDEATHSSPSEALDALNALATPSFLTE